MIEKNYMKREVTRSNKLGCNVNVFLTVKYKGDKVRLIVTHISSSINDDRNVIVSDEIVPRDKWEMAEKFALTDMDEI